MKRVSEKRVFVKIVPQQRVLVKIVSEHRVLVKIVTTSGSKTEKVTEGMEKDCMMGAS
jgi:hypothetical protein